MATKMTEQQVHAALAELPGWSLRQDKLHRQFEFTDFIQAFGFMARVALVAQAMNHHPTWCNVYKTVRVDLDTHDVDGISELDVELAKRMNELAG